MIYLELGIYLTTNESRSKSVIPIYMGLWIVAERAVDH